MESAGGCPPHTGGGLMGGLAGWQACKSAGGPAGGWVSGCVGLMKDCDFQQARSLAVTVPLAACAIIAVRPQMYQLQASMGWLELANTVKKEFGEAHKFTALVPDLSGAPPPACLRCLPCLLCPALRCLPCPALPALLAPRRCIAALCCACRASLRAEVPVSGRWGVAEAAEHCAEAVWR